MLTTDLYYLYLVILSCAVAISMYQFKRLDYPGRIVAILITLAFITEISTLVLARNIKVKNPAYHIYSIFELFLTSYYFLKTVKPRNIKVLVWFAIILCPALGILNMQFQNIRKINSYMLIFESFVIICMAMFSLYKIMIDEDINSIGRYPHFWIWAMFLLYWSGSFFYWAFLGSIVILKSKFGLFISIWQEVINIILYLGIGIAFLLFPKKVPA